MIFYNHSIFSLHVSGHAYTLAWLEVLTPFENKGEFAVSSNNIVNSIEISNLLGEVVYASRPAANHFSVDCTSYPKGIYFVKITAGEGISIRKIIYQ